METNDSPETRRQLQSLEAKIKALLPARYHECYQELRPVSMGSAALELGPDGKVAWDRIWTSYCQLALAGGPPHRGALLEPAAPADVAAEQENYQKVVAEIGRGVWLVTGLPVLPYAAPGWVAVRCRSEAMAAWLLRAVVVENVMARQKKEMLFLPAGPHFRVEKEIKNVVTAVAKTNHYWHEHMDAGQQALAASVVCPPSLGPTLLQPASPEEALRAAAQLQTQEQEVGRALALDTGLSVVPRMYTGWIGLRCQTEAMAVWLMRAILVDNILVRREAEVLFLPANPTFQAADCERIRATVSRALRLWHANQ